MDSEEATGEDNEESLFGKWRKGNPCSVVVENLTTLSSAVMWKPEHVTNEIDNLAEKIFNQNVEGATWFLFADSSKMQNKRDRLKELLK